MKKLIAMLLVLTMALGFAACAAGEQAPAEEVETIVEAPETEETPEVEEDPTMDEPAAMPEEDAAIDTPAVMPDAPAEDEMPEIEYMPEEKLAELSDIMDQLVGGINDELMVGTMEITSDMYEYYAIPATEGAYAVVSMPMIGSIAHEVVLVELPEGTDVEAFVDEMESMMNPRKWVCVEAETTWVKTSGNYVLMVMSTTDMADAIAANFETVFGA